MKTFVINGKTYKAKEFDFNSMCLFQDNGIDLSEFNKKSMVAIRCYLADCGNIGTIEAGNELNTHIINGGTLDDLIKCFTDAVETSDFFRALNQKAEATPAKRTTKKTAESKDE